MISKNTEKGIPKTDNIKEQNSKENENGVKEKTTKKKFWTKSKIIVIIVIFLIICGGIIGATLFYYSPSEKASRSFSAANKFMSSQDYNSAIIELEKVIELDPENSKAYLSAAEAYINLNQNEKAIEILQSGLEKTSNDDIKTKLNELIKNQALEQGKVLLNEKNYEKAAEEFKKAVQADENCAEAYNYLSKAYVEMSDVENAISCLQTGIDKTDNDELKTIIKELKKSYALNNAVQFLSEKKYNDAIAEYRKVLDIDDKYIDAYIGIADAYIAQNLNNKAADILNTGFDKTSDEKIKNKIDELKVVDLLKNAKQYFDKKEYDSAKEELQKALNINDKCVDAYIGCANACIELKETDNAIEILQKGFEKTKDEQIEKKLYDLKLSNALSKGKSYLSEEKFEEAEAEYNKALELDEKCLEAYLGLTDSYIRRGDNENGIKTLEKGYEKTKDENLKTKLTELKKSTALENGLSYYNSGNYEEAVEEYKKAVDIDSECTEAYIGIADAYIKLNNVDKAIETLQTGYNNTQNPDIEEKLTNLKLSRALNNANSYYSNSDFSNAITEYQNALYIDYTCVEAYLGIADCYIESGNLSKADEILCKGFNVTWDNRIQTKIFEIRINYIPLSPQATTYQSLNELVNSILSQITTSNMSTYEKVKACYDYLINNCSYGHPSNVPWSDDSPSNFAEYFAYQILTTNIGVCDNYSCAFAAMLGAIGIRVDLRTGETTRAAGGYTGHTWCEVDINGEKYVFDPQVDDNIAGGGAIRYLRFCKRYDEVPDKYIP